MVVICLPAASLTGTPQERIATPSIWTVQAPHCAMPQPYLVPVRPIFSRIAQSSGVSGSTSTSKVLPLILRFAIAIPFSGSIHREDLDGDVEPEIESLQIKKKSRNPRLWAGISELPGGVWRFARPPLSLEASSFNVVPASAPGPNAAAVVLSLVFDGFRATAYAWDYGSRRGGRDDGWSRPGFAISPHVLARGIRLFPALFKQRAQGMPGGRCAR